MQWRIQDRFPRIRGPRLEGRAGRQLRVYRHQPGQGRTRTRNPWPAMALSHGVQKKWTLWTKAGRAE